MITKLSSATMLIVLLGTQCVPLNVMASKLDSNTTKSILSAHVYAKLGNSSSGTDGTTKSAPESRGVKFNKDEDATTAVEFAEIWDAATCRNLDTQFVVQKLMPTKDSKHSAASTMKMLGSAMYERETAGAARMDDGSVDETSGPRTRASMVMSILNKNIDVNSQRKTSVTETEAIMVANMVGQLFQKAYKNFHEYKNGINRLARSYSDYEKRQNMPGDALTGQDAAARLQMEFLLRKARREIDGIREDIRQSHDLLVALAGAEAVNNLDKQIDTESQKIGFLARPSELQYLEQLK